MAHPFRQAPNPSNRIPRVPRHEAGRTAVLRVPLAPPPALNRGQSFVRQCGGCGTLIHVPLPPASQTLGACSVCERTDWWPQKRPIGPFPGEGDGD
jgi:hypothetical protein